MTSKIKNGVGYVFRYFASALILFVLFFFATNYSAYYQIGKSWVDRTFYGKTVVEEKIDKKDESLLPIEILRNPDKLKTEITLLVLDVSPPDSRILIPRINKNVPLIKTQITNYVDRKWDTLDKEILQDLKKGVVMYPSSAVPGQNGNTVVTAHSSYYPWDDGKYKDVFARLNEVILGDKIIVYYQQKKYVYEVYDIKVVKPEAVEIMSPKAGENILTVITCTPVGTNLRRLVILAKQTI